jgi:hypothetical protein
MTSQTQRADGVFEFTTHARAEELKALLKDRGIAPRDVVEISEIEPAFMASPQPTVMRVVYRAA